MLSLRQNKRSVFSRTCAGKRHPESRERGDRKGVNGGKREGERSERESVVTRQNKDSRRDGGHAPPQRHLERSEATMKTRFTGRKRTNELREVRVLSSRHKNHEYLITCVNIPWTTYLSSGFDATFVQVESVMMRLFASNFTFLPICDFAYMVLRNSR